MSAAPRADIYIRESTVELLGGYSPDQMVTDCRQKAATLGATVERVVIEDGKRDEWECPGLRAEIDRAQAGEIDYLISWDTARLTGDLAKHLWLKKELEHCAVQIVYATVDFSQDDEGDMHENLLGLFNRYERLKIRRRTQNGIKGKLAEQRPIGNGTLAYGLERVYDARGRTVDYAPRAGQIEVLQRIVRDLEHLSQQTICDQLNAEHVPTPSGRGRWTTGIISRLVKNTTYTGDYQFGATRKVPGRRADGTRIYREQKNDPATITRFAIDAVIDPHAMAAARAGLAQRQRRRTTRRADADDPYTLRGRLTCGFCHGALSISVNNGYRRYLCGRAYGREVTPETRCPLPEVAADALEREVWTQIEGRLSDSATLEQALTAAMDPGEQGQRYERQVASVRSEIARLERRIANAGDVMLDFGKGTTQYDLAKGQSVDDERKRQACLESAAALERQRPSVLSADDAAAARVAWEDLRRGLAGAVESAPKQRRLYAALALGGRVTLVTDGSGTLIGRKHRFELVWDGHLQLSGGATDGSRSIALWDSQSGGPALRVGSPSAA